MNKSSKKTGADMVVNVLEELDVKTIFGIPGNHNLDIYDSLISSEIEHITTRHEQGAGFMADGYARTNNKPGVALVISGPGLTNIITPMGQAMADSVPMVVISSQLPSSVLGQRTGFLHELKNSTYLTKSVAKESIRVMNANKIDSKIIDAYQLASSGRPGPVHVEIPLDILQSTLSKNCSSSTASQLLNTDPWQEINQDKIIEETVNKLENAEESVIMVGGGATHASEELLELVEKLQIPVVETIAAKGIISEEHPLCLGASIKYNNVREKIKKAECVLAVGTEMAATDLEGAEVSIDGTLIQIDIDPANFQRNFPADISIKGDAKSLLAKINKNINVKKPEKDFSDLLKNRKNELAQIRGTEKKKIEFILEIIKGIRQAIPAKGILTADMTRPAYIARSEYPSYFPNTFLHPVGYGTLGYALPSAMGVKFANPQKDVVVLTGDGGFQFTIQELGVLLDHNMSLPIIIWNNKGFGEIRKNEKARHPEQTIAVDNNNPDFEKIAASYNFSYNKITDPKNMESTLKSALNKSRPEIIEIFKGEN